MERRQRVAAMYVRGASQMAIAAEVGVTQATVSTDLKAIRELWLKSMIRDFDQAKAIELAKLDHLESEAWKGWERSYADACTLKVHTEEVPVRPRGARGSTVAQEEERLRVVRRVMDKTTQSLAGDPRFLEQVERCIEMRLRVLGALKPGNVGVGVGVAVGGQQPSLPWDEILKRAVTEAAQPDPIEAEILAVAQQAPAQPRCGLRELRPDEQSQTIGD